MMSSREKILFKLKHKQSKPASKQLDKRLKTGTLMTKTRVILKNTGSKLETFIKKLELSRAEVYLTDKARWTETLVEILKTKRISSLLLGQHQAHQEDAIIALTRHAPNVHIRRYEQSYETIKHELFHDTPASLTVATAGITDTGTLLVIPDQDEPRMMSLIPEIHIVLLNQKDLFPTFQHLVQKSPWDNKLMPTNILFISSPSKTADIQQTIAYGAHGPKELLVIVRTGR